MNWLGLLKWVLSLGPDATKIVDAGKAVITALGTKDPTQIWAAVLAFAQLLQPHLPALQKDLNSVSAGTAAEYVAAVDAHEAQVAALFDGHLIAELKQLAPLIQNLIALAKTLGLI